jgi:hypothetical protein
MGNILRKESEQEQQIKRHIKCIKQDLYFYNSTIEEIEEIIELRNSKLQQQTIHTTGESEEENKQHVNQVNSSLARLLEETIEERSKLQQRLAKLQQQHKLQQRLEKLEQHLAKLQQRSANEEN